MAKAHASAGEQLYMCAAKRTPCTTARPAEPAGPIVPTPCSAATADASESTHTSGNEAQRAGRACEDRPKKLWVTKCGEIVRGILRVS